MEKLYDDAIFHIYSLLNYEDAKNFKNVNHSMNNFVKAYFSTSERQKESIQRKLTRYSNKILNPISHDANTFQSKYVTFSWKHKCKCSTLLVTMKNITKNMYYSFSSIAMNNTMEIVKDLHYFLAYLFQMEEVTVNTDLEFVEEEGLFCMKGTIQSFFSWIDTTLTEKMHSAFRSENSLQQISTHFNMSMNVPEKFNSIADRILLDVNSISFEKLHSPWTERQTYVTENSTTINAISANHYLSYNLFENNKKYHAFYQPRMEMLLSDDQIRKLVACILQENRYSYYLEVRVLEHIYNPFWTSNSGKDFTLLYYLGDHHHLKNVDTKHFVLSLLHVREISLQYLKNKYIHL